MSDPTDNDQKPVITPISLEAEDTSFDPVQYEQDAYEKESILERRSAWEKYADTPVERANRPYQAPTEKPYQRKLFSTPREEKWWDPISGLYRKETVNTKSESFTTSDGVPYSITSYNPKTSYTPSTYSKWESAGCVVIAGLGEKMCQYVYLIRPSNGYGPVSFPKGRIDDKEVTRTAKETAIIEVREETGLECSLVPGGDLGRYEGTSSHTTYFMAYRTGGSTKKHDFETESVYCLHIDDAISLLKGTSNKRDIQVAEKAKMWISGYLFNLQRNKPKPPPTPPTPEVKTPSDGTK